MSHFQHKENKCSCLQTGEQRSCGKTNRKVITCLRTPIDPHNITWDTWIPHVACALNTQIDSATGETPLHILFGEDKNLPYSFLESEQHQVYNYDDFILTRINKFKEIYQRVRYHMKQYSQDLTKQQHKRARDIKIQPGDIVMAKLHKPLGNSNKLSPKLKKKKKQRMKSLHQITETN